MKKTPRALLLIDWLPETGSFLLESLRKNGLDCDVIGINFHQSKWTPINKVFSHWPRCFWASLQVFRRRHDYDYVLAWQQIMGMFLGMFKLFTFSNSPKVFILVATIVERENLLLEKLRKFFVKTALKKVDYIGFVSDAYRRLMRDKFNLPDVKTVHLPLPLYSEKNPDFSGFKPGSYLYSVGLSHRDYETLMAAAAKTQRQFAVATHDVYLKGLSIPDNVTIYRNTFGEEADALMEKSAAVILTLNRIASPAGESALVRTMCYGKPLIVTKTVVTQEYITDGQNGFLVPWKDSDAIVDAINKIFSDPEKADAIGRNARQTVLERHTMDGYAKKIIDIIEKNL
ncbi:MAG: glycosyltransferase family 4 protein [Syntrophales bacterium LBB04]|nr:glycosyltransferase family 4 protein [Syntrophales bacterium LBB04]